MNRPTKQASQQATRPSTLNPSSNHAPSQSNNQSINQSINQSSQPSIHQSIHQSSSQSINQPIDQSVPTRLPKHTSGKYFQSTIGGACSNHPSLICENLFFQRLQDIQRPMCEVVEARATPSTTSGVLGGGSSARSLMV